MFTFKTRGLVHNLCQIKDACVISLNAAAHAVCSKCQRAQMTSHREERSGSGSGSGGDAYAPLQLDLSEAVGRRGDLLSRIPRLRALLAALVLILEPPIVLCSTGVVAPLLPAFL